MGFCFGFCFFVDLKLFSEIEELFGVCVCLGSIWGFDHQNLVLDYFRKFDVDPRLKPKNSIKEKQQTIFFRHFKRFLKIILNLVKTQTFVFNKIQCEKINSTKNSKEICFEKKMLKFSKYLKSKNAKKNYEKCEIKIIRNILKNN
jgi:hypothetical protein